MALHEVYSGHLSAYKAACEVHPDLKSYDASLQKRTAEVADKINNKVKTAQDKEDQSLSIHATYMEVCKYLLDVTKVVADFIKDNKAYVRDNKPLNSLINSYFENTLRTLKFFITVENVVNKAEMGQLIIQTAVDEFDKETAEKTDVHNKKNKYENTLKELKAFKDMEEEFDSEKFKTEFESVKKEQVSLLEEVTKVKQKLEEEYSHIQDSVKVTNAVFGAVFAVVAVVGVVTFFFGGAALVGAAGAAGTVALTTGFGLSLSGILMGWVETQKSLQKLEDTLKKQQELVEKLGQSLRTNKVGMETIYLNLQELITKISSILGPAGFALTHEQEHAIEKSMHLIKTKVEDFTQQIIEVGGNVVKFSKLIIEEIYEVMHLINDD